jgi:hypothetical protein
MSLKRSVILVILLTVVCIGQQAFAQQISPANPGSEFVLLSHDDFRCNVDTTINYANRNGELVTTVASVKKLTCQIIGKNHGRKKQIDLVSTEVIGGMLSTKDFGQLKLEVYGSGANTGVTIAIRSDQLQSLRDFLQK